MEKLLSIGKILNFHGIQGEVKVGYTPGKESQLSKIKRVFAVKNDWQIELNVELIRFHKKSAIIKFKEINSINEAAELKGCLLKTEKSAITDTLEEDEYYIDDLVGLSVFDGNNNLIGKVSFVANQGQGHLIAIESKDGQEHYVPFVKDLVPEVNIKERKVIINNIPGLIEIGK